MNSAAPALSASPTAAPAHSAAAGAEPRRLGRYRFLAGLQVADVATTWVILANYSSKAERNPVVATMIDHAGLQVAMVALLVVKLTVVYLLYEKQTGVNLMSAIYGLVIFNNLLALGLAVGG